MLKPKLLHPIYHADRDIAHPTYLAHRRIKGQLQAAISFLIGIFMAAGGRVRWAHQSLEVAMGFPWAPVVLGTILIMGSTVLWCAILADAPKLRWYGCWICAIWHLVMMIFAVWKFATDPSTVDDVAFFLWFFLATDYVLSASISVSWINTSGPTGRAPA